MWSATGISFPRSLQSLLSLDKLQKCPGRALGNLLCLALLRMQSTLSSREVQVHVLLFTCFLSCEWGDLTMKSFPLHWWKCPTGSQDQINADPCIVYILQHKSLYNQSSFIWLDSRLRKLPFIRLHFKWSAFQYLWNLGNVQLLPWVWALFIVFYIALFPDFTLLYFFSVARLRYFSLSCMPLILHMLFALILPWFLISFVLTLLLCSSNRGALCKYSYFTLPCRRADWCLVAAGLPLVALLQFILQLLLKNPLFGLCVAPVFCAEWNKSSFVSLFFCFLHFH